MEEISQHYKDNIFYTTHRNPIKDAWRISFYIYTRKFPLFRKKPKTIKTIEIDGFAITCWQHTGLFRSFTRFDHIPSTKELINMAFNEKIGTLL